MWPARYQQFINVQEIRGNFPPGDNLTNLIRSRCLMGYPKGRILQVLVLGGGVHGSEQ